MLRILASLNPGKVNIAGPSFVGPASARARLQAHGALAVALPVGHRQPGLCLPPSPSSLLLATPSSSFALLQVEQRRISESRFSLLRTHKPDHRDTGQQQQRQGPPEGFSVCYHVTSEGVNGNKMIHIL